MGNSNSNESIKSNADINNNTNMFVDNYIATPEWLNDNNFMNGIIYENFEQAPKSKPKPPAPRPSPPKPRVKIPTPTPEPVKTPELTPTPEPTLVPIIQVDDKLETAYNSLNAKYPLSTDGRCGKPYNNTRCGPGQCCSTSNWCGGEIGKPSAWCSVNNGTNNTPSMVYDGWKKEQSLDVTDAINNSYEFANKKYPVSTDGRCGRQFNNSRCGPGQCCSPWGWCGGEIGKPSAWCSVNGGRNNTSSMIYDGWTKEQMPDMTIY